MTVLLRLAVLGGLLWGLCSLAAADTVRGSGRIATETRALAGYQAVVLRGPFKVELRQSGREGLELRGDDNLLPLVETTIVEGRHGKTLDIAYRRGVDVWGRHELAVVVNFANLQAVSLNGSGDIVGQGLKFGPLELALSGSGDMQFKELSAERLAVSISGSGDVVASGRSGQCALSISGSGDVSAGELACDDVTVRIVGSGDAKVQAHKTLGVSIAGSGDVRYTGEPKVTSSIAGSGSVSRR